MLALTSLVHFIFLPCLCLHRLLIWKIMLIFDIMVKDHKDIFLMNNLLWIKPKTVLGPLGKEACACCLCQQNKKDKDKLFPYICISNKISKSFFFLFIFYSLPYFVIASESYCTASIPKAFLTTEKVKEKIVNSFDLLCFQHSFIDQYYTFPAIRLVS